MNTFWNTERARGSRSPLGAALLVGSLIAAGGCDLGSQPQSTAVQQPHRDASASTAPTDASVRSTNNADASALIDASHAQECNSARFRALRITSWPGEGLQIIAELPADIKTAPSLSLNGQDFDAQRWSQPASVTAIVVVPSPKKKEHLARLAAAHALLAALPPGERVTVWLLKRELQLVSDVTHNRKHHEARLNQLEPEDPGDVSISELESLRTRIQKLDGPYGAVGRFIVAIGIEPKPANVVSEEAVGMLWLTGALAPNEDASVFSWSDSSPEEAAAALATKLGVRRDSIYSFGICDAPESGDSVRLELNGEPLCGFPAPAFFGHELANGCDAAQASTDDYPFVRRVDLLLSPKERAVFDDYTKRKSEADFAARLRFGDGPEVPVRAHFRGQTSLDCPRKSLAVDLDGPDLRRIAGNASADEFFLISMCKDEGYFRQLFGNRLYASLGLFPLQSRLVELFIDGKTMGAYLLLEKPHEAIPSAQLGTSAVVRRRFDPGMRPPTVKLPKAETEAQNALGRYSMLGDAAKEQSAAGLPAFLSERLDLEAYLRLLALNALLINGDSVDEVYFYASAEGTKGAPWFFRVMAWDLDDLVSGCHHRGKYALSRDDGLMYCSEGDLDYALLRSDEIYERYLMTLEHLTKTLTAAHLESEMLVVKKQLFGVLASEKTCGAMTELLASEPAVDGCAAMKEMIETYMARFLKRIESNRLRLRAAIEEHRNP